jgi:hypothetical protein
MWLQAADELVLHDFSIVSAGIKTDALADDNSRFWEHGQRDSPIAFTIPLSIPAKTN